MSDKREEFLELLRSQHSFPGPFTLKFIGAAEDSFVQRLVAAVRAALHAVEDPPHSTQPSKNQGYVAVTLMPIFNSPEQVLEVYDAVRSVKGLKVSL